MLSKNPSELKELPADIRDMEILRYAIVAELDAINLYDQLANYAVNEDIKHRLLHVAKEEKTHVGEFQTLLLMLDKEQEKELENGREEVEEDL